MGKTAMDERSETAWGQYDETERHLSADRARPVRRERGCLWWLGWIGIGLLIAFLSIVLMLVWAIRSIDCFICT